MPAARRCTRSTLPTTGKCPSAWSFRDRKKTSCRPSPPAGRFGAPVLSRGGGTSLAGQCCNVAVVIDWSKYMHGVLEVNTSERWARVLPGTVCDELRDAALRESNNLLTWGPDPATHDHCCFGGMIGNNSCGAHAQMSGKTDNNIEELEVLLYDGTRMTVGWMNDAEMDESNPARRARRRHLSLPEIAARPLRRSHSREVSADPAPRLRLQPRPTASGREWPLQHRTRAGRQRRHAGHGARSEVQADRCQSAARRPHARISRCLRGCRSRDRHHFPSSRRRSKAAITSMYLRTSRRKAGRTRARLKLMPEGKGWLMAEFGADKQGRCAGRCASRDGRCCRAKSDAPSMKLFTEKQDMAHLWEMREAGLGATAFVPGERRHVAGMGRFGRRAGEARTDTCASCARCIEKYDYNPSHLRPLWTGLHSLPRGFRSHQRAGNQQMALVHGRGDGSVRETRRQPQRRARRRAGARRVPEQDVRRGVDSGVPRVQVDLGSGLEDESGQSGRSLSHG